MTEPEADAAWKSHHNYADLVTIVVTPIETPDETDGPEQWIVVSHGAAWDQDWLVREVEALGLSFHEDHVDRRGDYVLRVNQTRFSWGADATQCEVFLWLAQWAATSAAWDALKSVSKRMAARLQDDGSATPAKALTEAEVDARARWLVSQRYQEVSDSLTLTSIETRADGTASIIFNAPSGWTYELDLSLDEALVTVARVKRSKTS